MSSIRKILVSGKNRQLTGTRDCGKSLASGKFSFDSKSEKFALVINFKFEYFMRKIEMSLEFSYKSISDDHVREIRSSVNATFHFESKQAMYKNQTLQSRLCSWHSIVHCVEVKIPIL